MVLAQSDEQIVEQFSGLTWEDWVTAAAVLVVGLVVSRLLGRAVHKAASKARLSDFVVMILSRLVSWVVAVVALSLALQALDVSIGPLIGALGIAGLALALAFQDILENVIAGLLMLVRRPIAVGHEIITNDFDGTVIDITMKAVVLTTLDGETVHVPNAMVWKNPLTNITATPDRRTRLDVGVAYGTDLDRAKQVLEAAVVPVEGVAPTPPPAAFAFQFGESSIDFAVFYWHAAPTGVQWRVRDEVTRSVKRALDSAGIEIPFPQRVVHLPTPPTTEETP